MSSAPSLLPSASDSASLSPTLRALQIKFTYLFTYLQKSKQNVHKVVLDPKTWCHVPEFCDY